MYYELYAGLDMNSFAHGHVASGFIYQKPESPSPFLPISYFSIHYAIMFLHKRTKIS